MFIKLNKPIQILTYEIQQHYVSFGNKITYSKVSTPLNDIFSLIPERYRTDFILLLMEISGNIAPHTDSDILSTINIYIKTDNCKTVFHDLIDSTAPVRSRKIKNQTNGRMFDPTCLKVIGEFEAVPTDAWLLDVTRIHSVISAAGNINRKSICLQTTKHSIEHVKEMLSETGYL